LQFNLRGREWTDPKNNQVKYFNTLEAWKIEKAGVVSSNSAPAAKTNVAETTSQTFSSSNGGDDDLPF